ncbi:hypothetical protein CE195_05230 [Sodalis-like symbiont of Philaenus spumarius]|nr:hypothetical protein CE195_05230 [Sodalis-like symbiont of Philaenus spumarius]
MLRRDPRKSHRSLHRKTHVLLIGVITESFFYRIKQFRRVATRYDKLSERFASFVALTAAFSWLC